jgi:hypothetical protein
VPSNEEVLLTHLGEQINLLDALCAAYDRGDSVVMLSMSTAIRVIVHSDGALLAQLDAFDDFPCLDLRPAEMREAIAAAFAMDEAEGDPDSILLALGLAVFAMPKHGNVYYAPAYVVTPDEDAVPFGAWWNDKVAREWSGVGYSRRDIILSTSNKDGGAHVDLRKAQYVNVPRHGVPGMWFGSSDGVSENPSPIPTFVRQIAEEVRRGGRMYLEGRGA